MMRIYATDSYSAGMVAFGPSSQTGYYIAEREGPTGQILNVVTRYDFVASSQKPAPNPSIARGAKLLFDFSTIPALRGKRITSMRGPFLCARSRNEAFDVWGVDIPVWYCSEVRDPYFKHFSYIPSNINDYRNLFLNPLHTYFDADPRHCNIPIFGGDVYSTTISACINSYPTYNSKHYYGEVEGTFDSHLGSNPPYIEIEYTDAQIEVVNCSPQSGFVNEKEVNHYSWSVSPVGRDAVGGIVQKSFTFQWRPTNNEVTNSSTFITSNTFLDVPAQQMNNGSFVWRVCATSDRDIKSPYTAWFELTTVDAVPLPPDNLSPDGGVRDGASPILLAWRHNSSLSTRSTGFDLQADVGDGNGFTNLCPRVTSADLQYTVPANTFPSGAISWRVRTYNSDGVAAPFSTCARMTIRAAPRTPTIRRVEEHTPRPLVEWLSPEQAAFHLQIVRDGNILWDSGALFGTQTALRIPIFLPDERYTLRVRVQNEFNLWSAWCESLFVVATQKRMTLTLGGESVLGGTRLNFDAEVL